MYSWKERGIVYKFCCYHKFNAIFATSIHMNRGEENAVRMTKRYANYVIQACKLVTLHLTIRVALVYHRFTSRAHTDQSAQVISYSK